MANNKRTPAMMDKAITEEVEILKGGEVAVQFSRTRDRYPTQTYKTKQGERQLIDWGSGNDLPDYREAVLESNNIAPQILRAKRDIILGGGMAAYKAEFVDGERILHEVEMPRDFLEWMEENEEEHGGAEDFLNDLLKHGNYFAELGRKKGNKPAYIKPHRAIHVRAEKQDKTGRIPRWWLYGGWGSLKSLQQREVAKDLQSLPAYDRHATAPASILRGADKLLGGPYYYEPHWAGSLSWMEVANQIPTFHKANLTNGFNIRYLVRVPEDYYLRALSSKQREDKENIESHIRAARSDFKSRLNKFLAGAENAGRGIILTKHIYKGIQKEWPEVEIIPISVDLKDEAMLKLFESSNTASTSAHGIPPALAGLATGAKMTSGSEIRNLYNFWQLSATPRPREIILAPYRWAWREMALDREILLGFRNTELTTTDKESTGKVEAVPSVTE